MKLTLLDMTQDILSALDSDEVNSIGDTVESLQVARIIRNKYYDISSRGDMTQDTQVVQLDSATDLTRPTRMYVPEGICAIEWIKYFNEGSIEGTEDDDFHHDLNLDITGTDDAPGDAPGYEYVNQISLDEFLEMVNSFNVNADNVGSYSFNDSSNGYLSEFTVYYMTDRQPKYCTIISNKYVLFDSYDSSRDSVLQQSKTLCFGQVVPAFSFTDNFIPLLDEQQFPLLLNEAKSLAFYELKQMPHSKADQEIKRQWSSAQRNKAVFNKPSSFDRFQDFGRSPRMGTSGVQRWMRP